MEKDFIRNVFLALQVMAVCKLLGLFLYYDCCSTWKVTMFLRVAVLVFLFLARLRFLKSESISSIVRRRYSGEILKAIRKFEKADYKLRKAKLDINFLVRCQHENVIPNFLKFRLANKDLRNSVTTRNLVWELYKMNLIVYVVIYNSVWTVSVLLTFPSFFLVVMIIF